MGAFLPHLPKSSLSCSLYHRPIFKIRLPNEIPAPKLSPIWKAALVLMPAFLWAYDLPYTAFHYRKIQTFAALGRMQKIET